jgi:hypothetical protein
MLKYMTLCKSEMKVQFAVFMCGCMALRTIQQRMRSCKFAFQSFPPLPLALKLLAECGITLPRLLYAWLASA